MPQPHDQAPELPLLGIDFVFEMGMKKIEEQVREVEALELKIGILLGFLGAVLVALLAVVFTAAPQSVAAAGGLGKTLLLAGVVSVGVAIANAYEAFRPDRDIYYKTARFSDLSAWANEEPRQTKRQFLDTLRQATDDNIRRLQVKQHYTNRACWGVLFASVSFLLAIIAIGLRIFVKV